MEEQEMEFANEMLNLRREIGELRAARAAMMKGLRHFNFELKNGMEQKMSQIHDAFARECASARAARETFNLHNRQVVSTMIGAFAGERSAARRNFMGMGA
jgi:hypothetical protein